MLFRTKSHGWYSLYGEGRRERLFAPFAILKEQYFDIMKTGLFKILFLFLVLLFIANACTSVARYTSNRFSEPKNKNENKAKTKIDSGTTFEDLSGYADYPVLETVTGVASFYADKYNGRITYNGEVYDMNGISAAHPTYPMNTIIRVTNLENGKSIILRINDRMPPAR